MLLPTEFEFIKQSSVGLMNAIEAIKKDMGGDTPELDKILPILSQMATDVEEFSKQYK